MDLSFSPEETAFRERMRTFFTTQIPQTIRDQVQKGEHVSRDAQIQAQRLVTVIQAQQRRLLLLDQRCGLVEQN